MLETKVFFSVFRNQDIHKVCMTCFADVYPGLWHCFKIKQYHRYLIPKENKVSGNKHLV